MDYNSAAISIIKNYLHLPSHITKDKTEEEYIEENFKDAIDYISNKIKENEKSGVSNVTSKRVGNISYTYGDVDIYKDSFIKSILPKPYLRCY